MEFNACDLICIFSLQHTFLVVCFDRVVPVYHRCSKRPGL